MTKTLLCALLLFSVPAWAAPVTVTWAPNPPEDGVVGYKLCVGSASNAYTCTDKGGATSAGIDLPMTAKSYLAVISYDAARYESDYSAEYVFDPTTLPKPPNPGAGISVVSVPATDGHGGLVEIRVGRGTVVVVVP